MIFSIPWWYFFIQKAGLSLRKNIAILVLGRRFNFKFKFVLRNFDKTKQNNKTVGFDHCNFTYLFFSFIFFCVSVTFDFGPCSNRVIPYLSSMGEFLCGYLDCSTSVSGYLHLKINYIIFEDTNMRKRTDRNRITFKSHAHFHY